MFRYSFVYAVAIASFVNVNAYAQHGGGEITDPGGGHGPTASRNTGTPRNNVAEGKAYEQKKKTFAASVEEPKKKKKRIK